MLGHQHYNFMFFWKINQFLLSSMFTEQQQQLNHLNRRFKEEVNQHLQDCRNSLQELEAQQIEFKGIMEKQSMFCYVALNFLNYMNCLHLLLSIFLTCSFSASNHDLWFGALILSWYLGYFRILFKINKNKIIYLENLVKKV